MARYWPKNGNLVGFHGLNSCGRVSDYDGICYDLGPGGTPMTSETSIFVPNSMQEFLVKSWRSQVTSLIGT